MQVTEPFTMFGVGEMLVRPIMNHCVPGGILGIARELIRQQRRDDGFVLRPPEFHVVPILLAGQSIDIHKRKHATMHAIPSTQQHPIEHLTSGLNQGLIATKLSFQHDEPSALDGVPGIQASAVEVIEALSIDADRFHDAFDVVVDVVATNDVDAAIDPVGRIGQIDRLA